MIHVEITREDATIRKTRNGRREISLARILVSCGSTSHPDWGGGNVRHAATCNLDLYYTDDRGAARWYSRGGFPRGTLLDDREGKDWMDPVTVETTSVRRDDTRPCSRGLSASRKVPGMLCTRSRVYFYFPGPVRCFSDVARRRGCTRADARGSPVPRASV